MDFAIVVIALGVWLGGAYLVGLLAKRNGRNQGGWFVAAAIGYLFGIIGLFVVAVICAIVGESAEMKNDRALRAAQLAVR
jgi:hypothetical protein